MELGLIVFNAAQRSAIDRNAGEALVWKSVECRTNREVRDNIKRMSTAIEAAMEHPDDPDCARLIAAISRFVNK